MSNGFVGQIWGVEVVRRGSKTRMNERREENGEYQWEPGAVDGIKKDSDQQSGAYKVTG